MPAFPGVLDLSLNPAHVARLDVFLRKTVKIRGSWKWTLGLKLDGWKFEGVSEMNAEVEFHGGV
jgi:hypothetical protein